MNHNSLYSNLTNISLLILSSTTLTNLNYDNENHRFNSNKYANNLLDNIEDWRDKAFNDSITYNLKDGNLENAHTLLNFTKKIIDNSKDIDGEIVDVVNDNFWSLI